MCVCSRSKWEILNFITPYFLRYLFEITKTYTFIFRILEETILTLSTFLPLSIVSQANSNEIVLASTHDVQEVDVSTLVAVQPYTWIGDDFDKESRRSDSGHLKDDIFTVLKETFSVPISLKLQTHSSSLKIIPK